MRLPLAALLLLTTACAALTPVAGPAPLRLGVTAPTDWEATVERAPRLGEALSRGLGAPVEIVVHDRYEELVEAIVEGELELAWLPPLAYVRARRQVALVPVRGATRRGAAGYRSALFVRREAAARSVADLAGARLALVTASSASGGLVPRALLRRAGVLEQVRELEYLGNHEAVCQAVWDGSFDAGAVFVDEADAARGVVTACARLLAGRDGELRIVGTSEPLPGDVLVAVASLAPAQIAEIGRALDVAIATPEGRDAVLELFDADGAIPVDPADWQGLDDALRVEGR